MFYFSQDQLGNGRSNSTIDFFISPVADFDNPGTPDFSTTTDLIGRALILQTDLADGLYDVRTTLSNNLVDWEREVPIRLTGSSGGGNWSDFAPNDVYRATGKVGIGFDPNLSPFVAKFEIQNQDVTLPIVSFKAAIDDGFTGPQVGNWLQILDDVDRVRVSYNEDDLTGFGMNGWTLEKTRVAPGFPFISKTSAPSIPLSWGVSVKHRNQGAHDEWYRAGGETLALDETQWYLKHDNGQGTETTMLLHDRTKLRVFNDLEVGDIGIGGSGIFHGTHQVYGGLTFLTDEVDFPNNYYQVFQSSGGNPPYDNVFLGFQVGLWEQFFFISTEQQDTLNPIDVYKIGSGFPFAHPESSVHMLTSGFGQGLEYVREDGIRVMKDGAGLVWADTATGFSVRTGSKDTGFDRETAGLLRIWDGMTPTNYRDLKLRNLYATGLTAGSIPFIGSGGLVSQDNANLFWDDIQNFLGLGTDMPENILHLKRADDLYHVIETENGFSAGVLLKDDVQDLATWAFDTAQNELSLAANAANSHFNFLAGGMTRLRINGMTGRVTTEQTLLTCDEIPTGAVNGVNALFTVSEAYLTTSLKVYLNGIRQTKPTDYTETSATTFTFVTPPTTGDLVRVDYQPA